jgi:hypothetical protein
VRGYDISQEFKIGQHEPGQVGSTPDLLWFRGIVVAAFVNSQ